MKVKTFDKINLKHIRIGIDSALKGVEKDFGIKIELGGITYQENTFSAKLNAAVVGRSEAGVSVKEMKYAEDLKKYSESFGLSGRKYGDKVTINRNSLILVGVAVKRRKYPIVFRKEDGKLILYTEDSLLNAKWGN